MEPRTPYLRETFVITQHDPGRALHYFVADALESLLPLIDEWADEVQGRPHGQHRMEYMQGYSAGTRHMAAEVKDQLVERILQLREPIQ